MLASTSTRQPWYRGLQQAWQSRFDSWLRRRLPPARSTVLAHRSIFILPTSQGLGFLFMLALMFVGAINYQASLAFALAFLLLSLFLLSILHTFRNLAGLAVTVLPGGPVFAGDMAEFSVILGRQPQRSHENLQVQFAGSRAQSCDLLEEREQRLSLYLPALRRGYLQPGRLRIETRFPLGLFCAWSLFEPDSACLVYPRPQPCDLETLLASQLHSGNTALVRGNEDFQGLRPWRAGDSLKQVAWKHYARGQGLFTKEYASRVDEQAWLRWDQFGGLDTEGRLSRLCYCVLQLDRAGLDFALELPGQRLPPGRGGEHCARALRMLALFESDRGAA
jgi:uncharacterized protein (DUF58 family)